MEEVREAPGAAPRRRLLRALPEVFLGEDAKAVLDGRRGLLFGEKRHGQVDILGVEAAPEGSAPGPDAAAAALVGRRWDRGGIGGWRIVGVALGEAEFAAASEALLDGLVAGDVVAAGDAGIFVHRGDRFARVR